MFRTFRLLLDPQGGSGGGHTNPDPAPTPPPPPEPKGPDLAKAIEGLLAKHGDPNAALRVLLNENWEAREANRALKAKLPADGSVVLAGDQAKELSTYQSLGKPADLRKALDDGATATARASALEKSNLVRDLAELHGYKPSVLAPLVEKLDLAKGVVKGKDGKESPSGLVMSKGEDGKDVSTPLGDYVEKHLADFLPALKVTAFQGNVTTRPQAPPPSAASKPEKPAIRVPRF